MESDLSVSASTVLMKPPCDEPVIRSADCTDVVKPESRAWVLVAAILGSSMAFIDSTVVNVALPALQSSLRANVVDVQWVVEAYGLFLSALILVGGSLGDFIGRRKVFVGGVLVFAAASLGCGLSTSIRQLILWRSLQGIGAAFLVPSSLAIISAAFDEKSRGQAIGTWSGFTAITTAVGPVLGGWLVENVSWHWVFFINLPLAAAVCVISLLHVPDSRNPHAGREDWAGALAATLGLGAIVYGLLESSAQGWRSPYVYGSLVGGTIALLAFVIIESRSTSPMLPLALLQVPSFRAANVLTLLLYAAVGIFFFLFPLNLIQVQGYSATATGAAALPFILLMFSLSRWSGGLVAHYGARMPLMIGPFIVALGFLLFTLPSTGASYWRSFFPAFLILGFGMAVSVAPLTTVVMSSVEQERAGTASGINNAVARLAGVLAIAVFGIVMTWAFNHRLESSLAGLDLQPDVNQAIQSNSIKLAGLEVPRNLDPTTAASVRSAVLESFIFGFRLVMAICALLAVASGLQSAAGPFAPRRRETTPAEQGAFSS